MRIINKFFIGCLLIACAFFASCSSCSSSKERAVTTQDSVPTFCKADTTEVLKMAETYLEHLKNKEFDAALDMLCTIENDSVKPLPEKERQTIVGQQNVFPVLDYKLESYKFQNENNVELTYTIEFFKKAEGEEIPNTIRITFAPERIGGVWYLTLMNKSYMSYLN